MLHGELEICFINKLKIKTKIVEIRFISSCDILQYPIRKPSMQNSDLLISPTKEKATNSHPGHK